MNKRKVCVVLVDRANYGRLRPVMQAIEADPRLELQTVVAGTMVLERFGSAAEVLRQDGLTLAGRVYMELEGNTPATMAKSIGLGIMEFTNEFQRLEPEVVVVIGDRYEALGAAVAAAYMNLTLVHIQGGEVSGSIDESTRHAITKFAHYHFPSTGRAAEFLVRMGERPETILGVGCPSSDLARTLDLDSIEDDVNTIGSGALIDLSQPYLLTLFHPTTTEYGDEATQMCAVLETLEAVAMPTILLWPNIDAGSDHISKEIRSFRSRAPRPWLRVVTNLQPEPYLRVLARSACAVGNSSSFVRDAGYFGTPVVLVGHRQAGRERGAHVVPAEPRFDEIHGAVRSQLLHGPYPPIQLYGDGQVSLRIVEGLATLKPYAQKRLAYVDIPTQAAVR